MNACVYKSEILENQIGHKKIHILENYFDV